MLKKGLILNSIAPATLFVSNCLFAAGDTSHPNVVLVMTDDQGYGNLGCTGNPILKTPNIDELYNNSTRLANYHVDPTCAPSRSALLTGKYSDRVGCWHTIMGRNLLRTENKTIADYFKNSGYNTAVFGKWHLGDNYPFRPQDRGFDYTLIHGGGGISQAPDFWGNDYFDDVYKVNGKLTQFTGFCTDVFFEETMKYIDKNSDKPFFVYLSTNAPHSPMFAPDKYYKRFNGMTYKGKKLESKVGKYYAMIENIDYNMGLLVDYLKKKDLYKNTIFIFTTDNGPSKGYDIYNANMKGKKGSNFDGGHRVPFFIHWEAAGINKPTDINELTAHVDVLPTLIDLCNLNKLDNGAFDGQSITPLLINKGDKAAFNKRALVVESQRIPTPIKFKTYAVMKGDWRLVGNIKKPVLNNIAKDPSQANDLSSKYPEIKKELENSYNGWWDDVSSKHNVISRIILGSEFENPSTLCSHDWFGEAVVGQKSVAKLTGNGFKGKDLDGAWKVELARTGWYQISMRRWPAEADKAINDAYIGKSLNANEAHLEIAGQKLTKPVQGDEKEITFRVKLDKGPVDLKAFFVGKSGRKVGAFYTYVLFEDGRDTANWQTREALGKPLAVFPKKPGIDTTSK